MAKDSKMYYIDDDIKKIQIKTNLFIQEYGKAGAFHLAREIIQNNFDECLDENSPGNRIEITYDRATDVLTASDNGRGFPEKDYPLDIFCVKNQSGSKFFRDAGSNSAGEFGVGMTVVNALSDVFTLTSYREEEKTKHTIEFHEGIKEKDKVSANKNGKHGSDVSFRVSKKYLGEEAEMPIEDVINWIESLFFLDSENLKAKGILCSLSIYNGMELEKTYKFKPQPFSLLLTKMVPADVKKKQMTQITTFNGNTSFLENSKTLIENEDGTTSVENVESEKSLHMDIAFQYSTAVEMNDSVTYDSYCNYTNTKEGGVHLDAFDEAYCRFMQSKINETMSDAQRDKLKVTWDDIRTNLFCVINLSTNAYVGFQGNAKNKITAQPIVPYMKEIITNGLNDFFKEHSDILNEYIKLIKINAKARLEAQKAKTATQTERLNTFKEHEMSNYIRCNNTGKNQFRELFIVEGNSASSGARNGSDPNSQAIFLLRGVVFNSVKTKKISDAMQNKEFRDLVSVMRCGIGPKFDIDKLYFNRINIFTDADVDGYFISSGVLAFFYTFYRPIIEAGKLYKVYSPLYRIDDKEHPFVANKAEMIDLYHKRITKNVKIKSEFSDSFMTKSEMQEFLYDAYDYRENLVRASQESGKVNKFLLESIIAYLTMFNMVRSDEDYDEIQQVFNNQKFIKSMMSKLQKDFPEIVVDNHGKFSGVVDGKFSIIKVSQRFYRKTADLIPLYQKYGLKLTVKENDKQEIKMTIGEFLDMCTKYTPKILTRFKGLGELNGKQLRQTTLDINNRISVQYTVEDVERELAIFDLTHGASKKNAADRKEMMKKYKIKREDLDN